VASKGELEGEVAHAGPKGWHGSLHGRSEKKTHRPGSGLTEDNKLRSAESDITKLLKKNRPGALGAHSLKRTARRKEPVLQWIAEPVAAKAGKAKKKGECRWERQLN